MSHGKATPPEMGLSEERLRIHDAACPKNDGYFQVNLFREERARESELAAHPQILGDVRDVDIDNFASQDMDATAQQTKSVDALRLYTGVLASSQTPMHRFLAISPANDTHPWMAKSVMEEAGIRYGELESLEIRMLASETVLDDVLSHDRQETSDGSPLPSSDVLSIARLRQRRSPKRDGVRTRKDIRMRKHMVDRKQTSRSSGQAAGSDESKAGAYV